VYLPSSALWQSRGHQGLFLISTPAGILTDANARRRNLGGEVLIGIV
jgi:ribosomal protein S8